MNKQLIISVGREFGSGGHELAEKLAERLGLPMYDNNLLTRVAEDKEVSASSLGKYDEAPKSKLFSRKVKGLSNSPQENVANLQFEYLQKMAAKGESFVIVGRCAETKLKGYEGLISLFVLGDKENRICRIMALRNLSRRDACKLIKQTDQQRKNYHNYYCDSKWGSSRSYDLCLNSSRLSMEDMLDVVELYIRKRGV